MKYLNINQDLCLEPGEIQNLMMDISKLRFYKNNFKLFVKQSLCISLRDISVFKFWNSKKKVKKKKME